jgi:hypothetical protein
VTRRVEHAGDTPVPAGAPKGFVEHVFARRFVVERPIGRVWAWLNDPATFVEGQVWPYRVEFVDGGFEPGVLNLHHGPLLNVAGAIGEVRGPDPTGDRPAYRDLKYFYGSYAISPRLVRPTRLEFSARRTDGGTEVTLRLHSLVRRPFVRVWELSQRVFWSRFPLWMTSSLSDT